MILGGGDINNTKITPSQIEDHLMTPYGPPDKNVKNNLK